MYDELIKDLRESAPRALAEADFDFVEGWLKEAADAIEGLQKKLAFEEQNAKAFLHTAHKLLDEVPRWIPVTERLPEKNQIVVVVQHGKTWDCGKFRGLAYLGGNIHKWNWKNNTTKTVDYWMPKKSALPEPPEEG